MNFITEFLKMTRFEHAIMYALAVLIAETIALGSVPPLDDPVILISLIVPILIEMAAFSLNDYLDIETDRINNKKTPLVKGTISPKFALYFSFIAFIVSTGLAFFINFTVFVFVLLFNILAILYNWKLKDMPLAGNIFIGLSMAIPFLLGNLVVYPWLLPIPVILAILAFIAGVAREIVKSAEDMEGDVKARRSKTLPVVIGEKPAVIVASILYILFIPLTFAPFFVGLGLNLLSLAIIVVADGILLGTVILLLKNPSPESYKIARKFTLAVFAAGMIAILFASLSIV
jgi:geranylgeranylglycerol-phosphate geranylgeranyltransferase